MGRDTNRVSSHFYVDSCMKFLKGILIVMALCCFTACDDVEEPVCLTCQAAESDNKVLLEEFTGHRCKGCPKAHDQADALKDIYGDNLVIISIHTTTFANPLGVYQGEYKTPMGEALNLRYDPGNAGLPKGMVNRMVGEDGVALQGYANWGTMINKVIQETPKLSLDLEANLISNGDLLEVTSELLYFEAGTADHQLVLVVTEDSIISAQEDEGAPNGYIEEYVHKHVLRGSITAGAYGEQIKGGDIAAGEQFTFYHQLPWNSDWDLSHCHIVGYVINNSTREVWQADSDNITD